MTPHNPAPGAAILSNASGDARPVAKQEERCAVLEKTGLRLGVDTIDTLTRRQMFWQNNRPLSRCWLAESHTELHQKKLERTCWSSGGHDNE